MDTQQEYEHLSDFERAALEFWFASTPYPDDGGTRWHPLALLPILTLPDIAGMAQDGPTRLLALVPVVHPAFPAEIVRAAESHVRYAVDGLPLPESPRHFSDWFWRRRLGWCLPRRAARAAREVPCALHCNLTVYLPDTPRWDVVNKRQLIDGLLPHTLDVLRIKRQRVHCFPSNVTIERVAASEDGGWAMSLYDCGPAQSPDWLVA